MTAADVLDRAAELLESPDRWTKGSKARDRKGRGVLPTTRGAVRWDLYGAVYRYAFGGDTSTPLSYIARAIGGSSIEGFNDRGPHRKVLIALRLAARMAKEDQDE